MTGLLNRLKLNSDIIYGDIMGLMKVKDLITWLSKLDPEGYIYRMEDNTRDYLEIPDDFHSMFILTVLECKSTERSWLNHWYKDKINKDKLVNDEFNNLFKYTKDNGIIIRM